MTRTTGPLSPPPVPHEPLDGHTPFSWTALGVFGGTALFAYYMWLWLVQAKPVGATVLVGPLLVAVTAPFLVRAGRRTPGFDLGGLLLCGLVLRFAFVYYRYNHAVDAFGYRVEGSRLAAFYRQFDFSAATGGKVPGTGGMNAISGGVHVLVADDDPSPSFLVLTWLAFLGCWLLYRAFEISLDDGDHYRYARLVLLLPSMCFWPSSLGKDAWMVFTIGVAAFGAARVFRRSFGGYMLMGLGLFGAKLRAPTPRRPVPRRVRHRVDRRSAPLGAADPDARASSRSSWGSRSCW